MNVVLKGRFDGWGEIDVAKIVERAIIAGLILVASLVAVASVGDTLTAILQVVVGASG